MQKVIKSTDLNRDLSDILSRLSFDKLFLLTDENTEKLCYPLVKDNTQISKAGKIIIKAGDDNKNIETLSSIWKYLSENGATRHSLLINLGGGMLTDIGGFAAASFKRGIKCINIPTTLLGAVDAAVGGKTGINFNGLKNEIGAFAPAETVLIDSAFFKSLDHQNFLSGYAEMIKHGLIDSDKEWLATMSFDTEEIDYEKLKQLVVDSVGVKEHIVEIDPFEKGMRKALNLGHTIGHAFESMSYELNKPVQHGYAVAWGIICELYLSHRFCGFPKEKMYKTIYFIKDNYHGFYFDCDHYERLYEYMKHDKKNESDTVNFTFLSDVGKIEINQTASKEDIFDAIDFLRESVGL
ncbi:MAG: 3-dehydroquinate synthase [Dysgonomonas mossii]|uniref:3-dehydroquinate synthase n=1 Tax=Dysgonomonas mossii TaxID=163665 RepID=UPI001D950FA1|nr:3-dehydroquinate synthase [Dysgonomonas mossii]MBS5795914.1 3-dehydroquinate synthase [Dysgonomonas mossii]MBS7111175.1 3-dehydroquinate synthase [Dysgonomonas mossii]